MAKYTIAMRKIGFFEAMFHDIGHREREALNEAAHSLAMQNITAEASSRGLEKLFALDRAQAEEISQLRALLEVISEMLIDAEIISPDALKFRMKDKLQALEEAKHSTTDTKKPSAPEPQSQCSQCNKTVLSRNTQISANGIVCDTCYYL